MRAHAVVADLDVEVEVELAIVTEESEAPPWPGKSAG